MNSVLFNCWPNLDIKKCWWWCRMWVARIMAGFWIELFVTYYRVSWHYLKFVHLEQLVYVLLMFFKNKTLGDSRTKWIQSVLTMEILDLSLDKCNNETQSLLLTNEHLTASIGSKRRNVIDKRGNRMSLYQAYKKTPFLCPKQRKKNRSRLNLSI